MPEPDSSMPKRAHAASSSASKPEERILTLGADFAGLDTAAFALERLGVPFKHSFSADFDKDVQKFIQHHHRPEHLLGDISQRDYDVDGKSPPSVSLYVVSPPCEPFSSAGKRGGFKDPRNGMWRALDYIVSKLPEAILLENVPKILECTDDMEAWFACLEAAGYTYQWSILDTMQYGVPQARKRFYVQAVRADCLQNPLSVPPTLPKNQKLGLNRYLSRSDAPAFRALPDQAALARRVQAVLEKQCSAGVNPFITPVVIAACCSDAWSHASVDFSMTLTKSACSRFGHWLTSEGRFLDVRDYAMLQGFDPDKLDFAGAKIAPRAAASVLGNAMSLNVVESVLPHLLYSAGWLTDSEFAAMTKSVQQRWLSMQ